MYRFEVEGKAALGFDTGLDSRSFAQAKLAQFLTEPGLVVHPNGTIETWKASGVVEYGGGAERPPSMVIWGPPFAGERLDLLVNDNARQGEALAAVAGWTAARLLLGEQRASLRPFAAFIADNAARDGASVHGTVFFAPESLALRCMQAEGGEDRISGGEWYVHPDLAGTEAAAFTAVAMLYRALAGTPPFTALDEELLHQDIREGNFLPVRFAAPGLDERLAGLIQNALSPAGRVEASGGAAAANSGPQTAASFLSRLLEILRPAGQNAPGVADLFRPLSGAERRSLEKEREQFLKRKNLAVKTRRFVIRNTALIAGSAAAILIGALSARSIVKGRADGPTTAGMDSARVIQGYYGAFGELDHPLMEACVMKGAGKNDIEMVVNLFVITRVRQAYETGGAPPLLSAPEWKEQGAGPVESQVFGVTGLKIERVSGSEDAGEIRYRAAYTLWLPRQDDEMAGAGPEAAEAGRLPRSVQYTDELTLVKHKGNWRIAEINRAQY
jgi:hypothetical protein